MLGTTKSHPGGLNLRRAYVKWMWKGQAPAPTNRVAKESSRGDALPVPHPQPVGVWENQGEEDPGSWETGRKWPPGHHPDADRESALGLGKHSFPKLLHG